MTAELVTLLATPSHIDVFGRDDHGQLLRLARASSWSEARSVLNLLRSRSTFTLVAAGPEPPPSLLYALASHVDRCVLVPGSWLDGLPRPRPWIRARRAERLAAAHLANPIVTVTLEPDDNLPF